MRVRKITPQLSTLPEFEVDLSLISHIIEKYKGNRLLLLCLGAKNKIEMLGVFALYA